MKRQIRRNVFETNSSSTHSITICSEEMFEEWKKGLVLFDRDTEEFVEIDSLSDSEKKDAQNEYERNKSKFMKDWDLLSEDLKEEYYMEYARKHDLVNNDAISYEDFRNQDLESYVSHYTTKSGDKIVAFGEYGFD